MTDQTSTGADLEELRARFRPLFERIAQGAAERDASRELPRELIRELADAGFGAVRVPRSHGGAGASLPQLIELLTDLAAADSNLPQALRGHFALVEDRLVAHAHADQSVWFERFVAGQLGGNAWTEIGAVEVGDVGTKVRESDGVLTVSGTKYYSTGSIFADWLDVFAQRESDGVRVIALVPADQPGVALLDDWDGFGQRTTGSGTTVLTDARVEASDVIDFSERFRYQTAFYQLVLLATLAGIAENAAAEFAAQAQRRTRVYSHGAGDVWNQDPLIHQVIGKATAQGFAARAVAVRAAQAAQDAYLAAFADDEAAERDANIRAELDSAQGQIVITAIAQEATSHVFDALGASAAGGGKQLDRFWRNARTVSSHNPVVFKERIVGDWAINGTEPPYVWAIGAQRATTAG
ncbi:acyl-CoA dehydrogenase family protein [Microbacterium soli]|uniref:Acyl-CoA dehydrogenase family protein n=1 Tax=Microbacterium soli TaxID=446075 RepID=A0ABP7MYA9_9MICO